MAAGGNVTAVGGSVTAAFDCQVIEYKLIAKPTSVLRSECANVEAAVEILKRNEAAVVAGFNMEMVRQRLASDGIW